MYCARFVLKMAEQQIANALSHVVQELRIQSLAKHVRDYHGEGTQKFMNWLQDVDQLATSCDSERMCILATLTLGGPAGTFVTRTIKENPGITWQTLRQKLKERYSDLTDSFFAKERCRTLKQNKGESVQNYAERLLTAATEAYDEIQNPDVQKTLVEIFQKGVVEDHLARKMIRKQFEKLDAAVTFATEEQRANKTFDMCRKQQTPAEPMEIGIVRETEDTKQLQEIQENIKALTKQMERVSRQVNTRLQNYPPRRAHTVPPRFRDDASGNRPNQFDPVSSPLPASNTPPHVQRPSTAPAQASQQRATGPSRPEAARPRTSGPTGQHDITSGRHRFTTDGRPICSACGRIGHIMRFCRTRGQVNGQVN